jgi:hypothetical protein
VRKAKLLSTVAAALLLSAGAVSAQGMSKDKPDRAPAAQQNAPAEKMGPSVKQGEHKTPQTTGQAASAPKAGKAETTGQSPKSEEHEKAGMENKSGMEKENKSGAASGKSELRNNEHGRNAKSGKSSETTGQSPKSEDENKAMEKKSGAEHGKSEFRSRSEQNERKERGMNNKSSSQTTTEKDRTTTGQGAASGSAKLSTEQRTKITTIFKEHRVEPARLNVSIRVGTRIPGSVHLYPIPTQVVEVYPEWRGYDYIFVGDQILVISPRTHEIVAILEV